jgi:hypothetical protein
MYSSRGSVAAGVAPARRKRGGGAALWLGALLALLPAPPARAQLSAEATEVVLAALPHVRSALPAGVAALDPEGLCHSGLTGWECPPRVHQVVRSLRLLLHGREFALVCFAGPDSCRLVGTSSLIGFEPPRVAGDQAALAVDVWWRTGGRPPVVAHRRRELLLTRQRGAWRVTGERER